MMTFVSRAAQIAAGGFGALSVMRWHNPRVCTVLSHGCESKASTTHGGWSENQHSTLCGDIEVVGFRNILKCFLGQPPLRWPTEWRR